jgi:hypothetical protein
MINAFKTQLKVPDLLAVEFVCYKCTTQFIYALLPTVESDKDFKSCGSYVENFDILASGSDTCTYMCQNIGAAVQIQSY